MGEQNTHITKSKNTHITHTDKDVNVKGFKDLLLNNSPQILQKRESHPSRLPWIVLAYFCIGISVFSSRSQPTSGCKTKKLPCQRVSFNQIYLRLTGNPPFPSTHQTTRRQNGILSRLASCCFFKLKKMQVLINNNQSKIHSLVSLIFVQLEDTIALD